jgi:hypothetical protein
MGLPPGVPGIDALLEHLQVVLISHRRLPKRFVRGRTEVIELNRLSAAQQDEEMSVGTT